MKEAKDTPSFYTFLLYLIGFILFLEWLYPASAIGDTSYLYLFVFYTVFCMGLTVLSPKWWLSLILKGIGLLLIIQELPLIKETFLSKPWFEFLGRDFWTNIQLLLSQEWYQLTPLFRSVLFLLVIWLMSYLIYYWFVVTKKFLLFVVLTIIYLSVMDTFTPYEADFAVVRTFFVSLIGLGFASFLKEINKESLTFNWRKRSYVWVIPLVIFVVFSAVIGYASPKYDPKWPDPVPFLKSAAGIGEDGEDDSIKMSGYSSKDADLGGPFIQDDSVVFEAIAPDEQYWRVDTKDIYTGKGWESSSMKVKKPARKGDLDLNIYDESTSGETNTAVLEFEEDAHIGYLPYPYEASTINAPDDIDIQYETLGAILSNKDNEVYDLNKYGITYKSPELNIKELQAADQNNAKPLEPQYYSVPDSLPDRVGELAQEITEPYETTYDKALAIEQYFGENDFVYEIEDVPIPDEDQDYVDQFLFETKQGYCDNYSTAMVVMLRTLGIPARWAKGFTAGEMVYDDVDIEEEAEEFDLPTHDQDYRMFEVRNLNAHSWVEVYFKNVGWVPFEPTQGFSNLVEFDEPEDSLEEDEEDDSQENELNVDDQEPIVPEHDEEDESDSGGGKSERNISPLYWLLLFIPIVAGLIVYQYRMNIQTWLIGKRLKRRHNEQTYQKAYLHLLTLLALNGYAHPPEQSLREYAKYIDRRYKTDEMGQLTHLYEKVLYTDQQVDGNEISQLWEDLVERVMT